MTQIPGAPPRLGLWIGLALLCTLAVFPRPALGQAAPRGRAVVNWTLSTDPTVVGYNVYYGSASGVYTNVVPAGNTNQVTISNLVPGLTYYAAVTSLNVAGLESDYSPEVSYAVPASLAISGLGNGSIIISGLGTSNQTYVIQYTTNWGSAANWLRLVVATASASGSFVLSDTAGPSPRFYRAVLP